MQNEITAPLDLLDANGHIINEGWARKQFWNYDRNKIKASWLRIKEWDYYYIISQDKKYGITFTMSDLGYAGLFAICVFDFNSKKYSQTDTLTLLPRGNIGFPPSSDYGDISFKDKTLEITYSTNNGRRIISFTSPTFIGLDGEKGLQGEITLTEAKNMDSMNIATSWKENRKAFYYNQKINCMTAKGSFKTGDREFTFDGQSSFGGLDWGRGNWTYKNRWYWGSASGHLKGIPFGWNIGYGFSDRSPASENIIFYNHKAHKLDNIDFIIDTDNYLAPWTFTETNKRFELDFQPVFDRYSNFNVLLIQSTQHQVFGYFNGYVVLDDGTRLEIKDFPGFAEDVYNRW